ncbi:MAG TPA: DnaJ family domain-containing protein [Polyangiales bacterium]|nr:DnaJ family domain-containing protein [Polyangiales bacterium]
MTRWIVGLLDAQVAIARERGAFEDLPGRGKPLEVDDLAGLSAEQRFDVLLARSLGEVAPEVAMIRSIRAGRQRISQLAPSSEKAELETALRTQVSALAAAVKARRSV